MSLQGEGGGIGDRILLFQPGIILIRMTGTMWVRSLQGDTGTEREHGQRLLHHQHIMHSRRFLLSP